MFEIQYCNIDKSNMSGMQGSVSTGQTQSTSFANIITDRYPSNYISMDGLGIKVKDDTTRFYNTGDYVGYISSNISNSSGEFVYPNIAPTISFWLSSGNLNLSSGITINFFQEYCCEIDIEYRDSDTVLIDSDTLYPNKLNFSFIPSVTSCATVKINFSKTQHPEQFVKIASLYIGSMMVIDRIKDINLMEEIKPLSDDLSINTFEFTAISDNALGIKKGSKIRPFNNGKCFGTYYIKDIERTGKNCYQVAASDSIGLLDNYNYYGFNTTSVLLSDIINEIQTETGLTIQVNDDVSAYSIYGYLPIKSSRFTICAIAWACGFMVDTYRGDTVVLRKIPTSVSSVIKSADKRIIGDSTFKVTEQIKSASVTYPSGYYTEDYSTNVTAITDRVTLVFDNAPIEVTGISGQHTTYLSTYNIVDFYTESYNITISGYKINFNHKIYNVSNASANYNNSKILEFKDFDVLGSCLSGLNTEQIMRSSDIGKYISSRGIVKAKIVLKEERVGDLISIETAYDGIITGIIISMNTKFGYQNIADIEVMEWSIG